LCRILILKNINTKTYRSNVHINWIEQEIQISSPPFRVCFPTSFVLPSPHPPALGTFSPHGDDTATQPDRLKTLKRGPRGYDLYTARVHNRSPSVLRVQHVFRQSAPKCPPHGRQILAHRSTWWCTGITRYRSFLHSVSNQTGWSGSDPKTTWTASKWDHMSSRAKSPLLKILKENLLSEYLGINCFSSPLISHGSTKINECNNGRINVSKAIWLEMAAEHLCNGADVRQSVTAWISWNPGKAVITSVSSVLLYMGFLLPAKYKLFLRLHEKEAPCRIDTRKKEHYSCWILTVFTIQHKHLLHDPKREEGLKTYMSNHIVFI
jgi:hypothetical protein